MTKLITEGQAGLARNNAEEGLQVEVTYVKHSAQRGTQGCEAGVHKPRA